MKQVLLFFTMLLAGLTTVSATIDNHDHGQSVTKNMNRYAEPIVFMERGIEFLIFPDGSFDFDAHNHNDIYRDTYYRSNTKRSRISARQSGPHVSLGYTSHKNYGVYISRDRSGKIRRIGNVYVNYDRKGKVSRIGSVFMTYGRGRNGTLRQVGGLQVNYNLWGEIVSLRGQVNHNTRCNLCSDTSCHGSHLFGNHNQNEAPWFDEPHDDRYYYYKRNGKIKKQKKRTF